MVNDIPGVGSSIRQFFSTVAVNGSAPMGLLRVGLRGEVKDTNWPYLL